MDKYFISVKTEDQGDLYLTDPEGVALEFGSSDECQDYVDKMFEGISYLPGVFKFVCKNSG